MAVVIFKAIEKCNSNCIYCEVIKKKQDEIMNYDLLRLIFIRMNEYLLSNPREKITFTWHGGEVCMLGHKYFETALKIQNEYCPETKSRIYHQVQSNLTLLTQPLIDIFLKLGIRQIGSSFEPIHNIRGFGKNRNSELYNRKFLEGVKLLNKNNMTWGIIYVVHKLSLERPLDIFYFLTNLNTRSHPNFNQVKLYGEDKSNLAITGEEFADFLGAIFPIWYKNMDRYPNIQPFSQYVKSVRDKDFSLICESSGVCSYRWIYIGPEGDTSQCGRTGDHNVMDYGNIKDYSFEEIMKNPLRHKLVERQKILPETECRDCRFWGICHGGCPLDAYMTNNKLLSRSPRCEITKVFIEKYFEPVTGMHVDFKPQEYIKEVHYT
ncbi:MAG: radical SAM protein [Bacteroidales bacterium]|nr:radical SAM protein [Bacteroidales bacterium]